MFVLQKLDNDWPREYDENVHFTWIGQKTELQIDDPGKEAFLELRLGYPQFNPQKTLTVRGRCVPNGSIVMPITKGWHSYFVPLLSRGKHTITLLIDEPLSVPGDDRFLGVMLSYAAVTDNAKRIEEIEEVRAQIRQAAMAGQDSPDLSRWLEQVQQNILSDEQDFYTKRAPPAPRAEDLSHPVRQYSGAAFRERWISQHVCTGSVLLDVGCGMGGFSHLRRKQVSVIGLDLSLANCKKSLAKNYTACVNASASDLPFQDAVFDYVISADVLGHIRPEDKSRVVDEFHRVLKNGGQCLHVIETDRFDPAQMAPTDYAQMVLPDGHIGLLNRPDNEKLFAHKFEIVDSFLLGSVVLSADLLIRGHDFYGANLPGDVLEFLLNANPREKEFFNLAAGWTLWKLIRERYDSKAPGGLLFLHARKGKSVQS